MSRLSFKEFGSGKPVVLLHGFPFSKELWDEYASALGEGFKVYVPDLPGFGQSLDPKQFSLPAIAGELVSWLREESITSSVIVGHSLGGYLALSMVDQAPDLFTGMVLFHSTALADTEEKKQSRDKVIEFVDKNGVEAFTSNSVLPLFADKGHAAIPFVKTISAKAKATTLKGYTLAMRNRGDSQVVLRNFSRPILFIVGKEDPGIPVETVTSQAATLPHIEVEILDNVGHMGMFEAKSETLAMLRGFLARTFSI
jgi:pimeloyl-ACP methyl ester carboxylesterase